MADVVLRDVVKSFGGLEIIKGIDLDVGDGEFCVFVGPSGCGKSTLLRMIAGLEEITAGQLSIGGEAMTNIGPSERGVAMVFQSYALYPHMTVAENIGFGLRMTGHPRREVEARVARAAAMLQLEALLDRKPGQLSGGQRQRVAIGRAIVREPGVFLFDEPLSNLDAALRVQMRNELALLHQQIGTTMIYVTHDQIEAMTLAQKIVVLNGGRVEQVGSPLDLYHRPRNLFVAGFIGSPRMNFLYGVAESRAEGHGVRLAAGPWLPLPGLRARTADGDRLTVGIRPEHVVIGGEGPGASLTGTLKIGEYLGSETLFFLSLPGGGEMSGKADGLARGRPGEPMTLYLPPAACHVFDATGDVLVNGDVRV